jgi:uncharacterized protein
MSKTVAIVGAGPDRSKFANKSVRAHLAAGWTVFPIHPVAEIVEGLKVYQRISEVPADRLDRLTVYLPLAVTLKVCDSWKAKPIREIMLNPGADSPEVVAKLEELGFNVICACSIVDVGFSPSQFEG